MNHIIIDGKSVAKIIKNKIAEEIKQIVVKGKKRPHLVTILVGHDGGSEVYVNNKIKACDYCGINSSLIRYEENVTENELLNCIEKLNNDKTIDGFIVQLPLPKHINEQKIIEHINPNKDVDGFTPINVGRMAIGIPCFIPATPKGVIELLRYYNIETKGKRCVILGRSNIVGKPNFITADMVKKGVVIIDVGTTRIKDKTCSKGYRLCGDVDFKNVAPLCSAITPVPGGVGPMTICMLMQNTLQAAKQQNSEAL